MRTRTASLIAVLTLTAGCDRIRPSVASTARDSVITRVDTIFPLEEALRRFQTGIVEPATALKGGEQSIEGLVERWVGAVGSHDTATVRRLLLNRSEFAYLYYPSSPFSRRPYYQPPDLVWFQFQSNGEKGIVRVLQRLGGTDLRYLSVSCPDAPSAQSENRIWEHCSVRRIVQGDTVKQELFGGIIERDGQFKFISYANQF